MSQRRNESQIEKSQDVAQLVHNKRMDEEHWVREQKLQESRRERRVLYEKELVSQIEAKRKNSGSPSDLALNRDYINNIKSIKDLLQEEIQLKEAVVQPKTFGKKQLGHLLPTAISIVGSQEVADFRKPVPDAPQNR